MKILEALLLEFATSTIKAFSENENLDESSKLIELNAKLYAKRIKEKIRKEKL